MTQEKVRAFAKMPKTISEILFDGLCASRGITCLLVAEGQGRTPDRELVFGSERVIVEVKEITPNKEEQESDRLVAERGYGNVLETSQATEFGTRSQSARRRSRRAPPAACQPSCLIRRSSSWAYPPR